VSELVSLHAPSRDLLRSYEAALRSGWSPNTTRDVAPEQLAAIERDPDGFIAGLIGPGGRIRLPDGLEVARLPDRIRWIVAEDRDDRPFVGSINLRWQEGTTDLPEHVLGHVGYTILPAHAGRGYASAALAGIFVIAREVGLPVVMLSCDADNRASRRVIEKNGGCLVRTFIAERYGPEPRLLFRRDLA
jgi:predicted acetyltransferase